MCKVDESKSSTFSEGNNLDFWLLSCCTNLIYFLDTIFAVKESTVIQQNTFLRNILNL